MKIRSRVFSVVYFLSESNKMLNVFVYTMRERYTNLKIRVYN